MHSRRDFLGALGLPAWGCAAPALARLVDARLAGARHAVPRRAGAPGRVAQDEDFWAQVGRNFTVDRSIVNLNNGGVSPAPAFVQDAVKAHLDLSNKAPSHYMWHVLEPQREGVRQRLARAFGCDPEEVAVTRNASESLQTLQLGMDLRPGDEVLTTTQDYPRMITTFRQRERREGVVLKQFRIPTPCEDPQQVVQLYEQHITPRTRLLLMCHVINLTGQILPVREVVAMARGRGIPVLVDGAHALAHLDFRISDLECDNYCSSLHKWLFAPVGTGFLHVKKDKIGAIWPLMAAAESQAGDIRKFEEIGTHPAANFLAIAEALTFHEEIGPARKLARLLHLRDWWARRLLRHGRVRLHTSLKPGTASGIACVEIEGVEPAALSSWLWSAHKILVTPIVLGQPESGTFEFQGIRVSPSVYTTLQELDRFCSAMEHVVQHGLPA
ncbi:MAG: aminotransferase class V-fold PLP-dependent enzyme [Planctomycetota bacterium]|nr:MAG: aminotransferase class V-fold PLP-dependent enzyme [Planctomycetota bacterium]